MGLHPFPASAVRQHLAHARGAGLVPLFHAAARAKRVRVEVLLAIGSRESHLGQMPPLAADWTGDGGHGRGIMQVDDRSHAAHVGAVANDDHAAQALYAAGLLAVNLRAFGGHYVPALAAFNAGVAGVRRAIAAGRHPDTATTGGDYSADVLNRAGVIARELRPADVAASGPGVDLGAVATIAAAAGVLVDPTLGAASGLALYLFSQAQSSGRIS